MNEPMVRVLTPRPATAEAPAATRLFNDLDQLIALDACRRHDKQRTAVFEFFLHRLPANRNFMIAAGLESVLDYLQGLRFTAEDVRWIDSIHPFAPEFLDWLCTFQFTGDVFALPEGTVFFADEPVLRIMAPLPQAQLIENRLSNLLHLQISVASKAARYRIAAGGKRLVECSMRHTYAAETASLASRAAYIGGFDSTNNAKAAHEFGIPLAHSMTHAFVQAHDSELEAFRNFLRGSEENPTSSPTLILDTYDIERSIRTVVELANELRAEGAMINAVRIDSGNLAVECERVRAVLDRAGLTDVRIMVGGSLEEHAVAALTRWSAAVDIIGIDSRLDMSSDSSSLDASYSLQEYNGVPCRRKSSGKSSWPGRRQIRRTYDDHGRIAMDRVSCADEISEGKALLQCVMEKGKRRMPSAPASEVRRFCSGELTTLPEHLLSLDQGPRSPVKISSELRALVVEVDRRTH